MQEGLFEPQTHSVAYGATQDPAQNVAPALVAGDHAVREEKGQRPEMVGDDAERSVPTLVLAVASSGELGRSRQDRLEQIGVVVGIDSLQHRRNSLQAGTRIDRRIGQRIELAVRRAVELHEDQVPDLQVTAVLAALSPRHRGQLGVSIDEDLTAGAARPGLAHRPEVVLRVRSVDDPLGGRPADSVPQSSARASSSSSNTVAVQMRGGSPQTLVTRSQPNSDRLGLEVVAKREVPQHLEESMVARARPDVLEIVVLARHTQTLLRRDYSAPIRRRRLMRRESSP